jgi:hypothetical protein
VVLGKISYLLDDAAGTAVITNDTIDQVALWVRSAISNELDLIAHNSETYRRSKAVSNGDGREILARILPAELGSVSELQFGVYHHRVMITLSFASATLSLGRIRVLRQHATEYARHVFDDVINLSNGEGAISHIVAYPVVFVPRGQRLLRDEDRLLKKEGFSHLYSTTTTTFCVTVRASRLPGDLRRHCLRVSVPGIIVYEAGRSISKVLVNAIVDAVYYGALYSRAEPLRTESDESAIEQSTERGGAATREMTLGSNELLLRVVTMLKERVTTERRYEFESALMILGVVITLLAATFSGMALLVR